MEHCLTPAAAPPALPGPIRGLIRRFFALLAPEDGAASREQPAVREAVKALPAHQRETVHLFYHEGYTAAEIGAMLGRREATVRSDLRRGRARLKEILKEVYDFEEGV